MHTLRYADSAVLFFGGNVPRGSRKRRSDREKDWPAREKGSGKAKNEPVTGDKGGNSFLNPTQKPDDSVVTAEEMNRRIETARWQYLEAINRSCIRESIALALTRAPRRAGISGHLR
jgi:hypothetical protein